MALSQLAQAMGGASFALPAIEEFCEVIPGVPLTPALLDDMLDDLSEGSHQANFTHKNMRITVYLVGTTTKIGRGRAKGIEKGVLAQVVVFAATPEQSTPAFLRRATENSPRTRDGLKTVLCELVLLVNKIKLRGLCDQCLTAQPPRKRLCLRTTTMCTECALLAATAS